MTKPLILIDGSSYFYRAFHALPPLTNSKGQPTGAVYGVANMVKRLVKTYEPTHMAVIFDAKGKTFRDDWYPEYKAHRPPTPPDLSVQFEPLQTLLKAMGLPILTIPGVEADDVIATLALQASAQGMSVLISTGDKDMAQLVNNQITLINTMSDQKLDPAGVKIKFGVTPSQIVDYLTLIGDTSDNVPGVHKCGPKTAVKWLEQYGTLDNVIAHADEISGKIGESLRASLAHLPLSKQLITLKTDVALDATPETLCLHAGDESTLQALSQSLEFKPGAFAQNLDQKPKTQVDCLIITTDDSWEAYRQALITSDLICVDTETTDLDTLQAEIVGIALQVAGQLPAYIPFLHEDGSSQLSRAAVLAVLKPLLEDRNHPKVGQNLKYDYSVFKNHGITLQGITYDTMLESYLLNSAGRRHDLDSLALQYLHHQTIQYIDIAGKGTKQLHFNQIPVIQAGPYAAEDAMVTLQLHNTLYPRLSPELQNLLHTIEVPLITVLANMERYGVLIDGNCLAQQGKKLATRIAELEQEATALAGQVFNLNSPKQLQSILYDEQKLPILAKTPTGQPSTAEAVLQELALTYELPALILEYRSLSKLMSTYIEALPKSIHPKTGRVHTSYNQAVTTTGRLSSSEPNLQNIPIRTTEGRAIRKAFIAPPGYCIVTADYSQIELRIMAHVSQDPQLLAAFSAGLDIHKATAAEIAGVPLDAVSSDMRRDAKAINFGLIYGMSAFGLAKQLGMDRQKAQRYIDRYFQRYPGVLAYMERTRAMAHQQGYVETIFGRRLALPDIHAQAMQTRKAAERAAINAPLQGSAADIIKKAMLAVDTWQTETDNCPAILTMQVHDELVFEVREADVASAQQTIKTLMEQTVTLSVPLIVSLGYGANWDEAH
jgi:DNA polymerase-1